MADVLPLAAQPADPGKPPAAGLLVKQPWTYLGCSRSSWYRHLHKPHPVRFGGVMYYRRADLERLVATLKPARGRPQQVVTREEPDVVAGGEA
jgi:hypothetical protein